eukprot:CAMPEP_0174286018 /NCGR_PEP_ID=MMETSP0809-20121228/10410_1 /TAXON_ID=73025 ORGANISM="Eutreptiella gymnastica-like, Strain CCMP1594" /NCGR_SAMPLE_ID=MMETSP0809 /ASSEMBLY_ACC=CAM_ASM_000658 /LENGTH=87 /DNA_ID=CAMNT_0015381935 /DNA_START=28 /DNA_END=291 /DNA_ORIENTATION=+
MYAPPSTPAGPAQARAPGGACPKCDGTGSIPGGCCAPKTCPDCLGCGHADPQARLQAFQHGKSQAQFAEHVLGAEANMINLTNAAMF